MDRQFRNDDEIKKQIHKHLNWDNRIDGLNIQVKISNGKVTLMGKVPCYSARRAAESDARSIEGVTSVNNQLAIPYSENYKIRGDGLLKSDIEKTLECNSDIDQENICVTVKSGRVVLEGTVEAYWKKVIAAHIVSNITGVIWVDNKITVVPSEKKSDKLIARDLVEALERNVNTDPRSINVKIKDGKITLSGSVPTLTAAQAAVETAHYTTGVKDVIDNIVKK